MDKKAARERFIERLGLATAAEGLPRIAGKIMAAILVTDGPHSQESLAAQLRASHGSISTNTRLLESLGVLERFTELGDRLTYFRLAPDPYVNLVARSIERTQAVAAVVAQARAALAAGSGGADIRLRELASFYDTMIRNNRVSLRELQARGRKPVPRRQAAARRPRARRSSGA